MKNINKLTLSIVLFSFVSVVNVKVFAAEQIKPTLSFYDAIKIAKKNDPWLKGNFYQQQSIEAMSIAKSTLPDPKVSIGFANVPVNGFAFDQEAMTQFKVGISQMFARGSSLSIKNKQLKLQSQQYPFLREDRQAKIAVTVGSLWLDLYRVQQSIALIEKNRRLFEQLNSLAEASYGSGLGKARQQDVIRAQLELTRLEDKLNQLQQQQNSYQGRLSQWLTDLSKSNELSKSSFSSIKFLLSTELPQLEFINDIINQQNVTVNEPKFIQALMRHPLIKAMDRKIASTHTSIELAEQKYKPQWGINASYGYRADDVMGNSRADFFSIGVAFDLPLFTENRQDNEVKSAVAKTEAIKTEKLLLLRQLMSKFVSAKGRLQRLNERHYLYQHKLLPQIHVQTEASLTAYTNDDGDFAEVVRSRIAELNAQIDNLGIDVSIQKLILTLNYIFIGAQADTSTKPAGVFQ